MFSPFHYISKNCIALKQYPTATIPVTHINVNIINNLGLIAFLNKIKEGILKVVTLIINERTTPSLAPFDNKASAMVCVSKNIRIHWNACSCSKKNTKWISISQKAKNPVFRNPVMNESSNSHSHKNIRKHFLKCNLYLFNRKLKPIFTNPFFLW